MNRQDDLDILGYDSVAGSVVPNILKDCIAFTFNGRDPCIQSLITIKTLCSSAM